MRLQGKVAIITGAGQGIGLGIARAFAREGARIALWDFNPVALEKALAETLQSGAEAVACLLDVSCKKQVDNAVEKVKEQWGAVDILVNNAGIYEVLPVEEISEGQWDRVLAVNLKGAFLCCQAAIPHLKSQGGGRIINMASSAGKVGGSAAGVHYSVSKAGVICLSKQLARELGPYNITVNAVAPGRVDTPIIRIVSHEENEAFRLRTPLGRLGTPEDIANAVVFLASQEASFITGEILDVNGGLLID